MRRILTTVALSLAAILGTLTLAVPANAATYDQKVALLSSFSQPTSSSYSSWLWARNN